jgi:rsbT co-antagonist protein RsbR
MARKWQVLINPRSLNVAFTIRPGRRCGKPSLDANHAAFPPNGPQWDDIIKRQSRELLELSTPVVQLWDKILAVPLIGTLDSERTQTVMENLLNHIVRTGAEIAIIDITGVPTVDTLVAQHLIKTVSAARLMGADCIISGIRPQIAQTIVHLGLQLDVISKATMADALGLALKRTGQMVSRIPLKPA